jgi:anion-transporting  ArsA/GET3 family ATPase
MTKLTETQATILTAGAQRHDNIALPLPKGLAGAAAKMAVTKMIDRGWLQEVEANLRRGEPLWRETGDGHGTTLMVTEAGLLAIGMEPVVVKTVMAIRKQATDVIELLSDPTRCQVLLVTIPEETPVNELVDTAFTLEDRVGVALGPIVVNGCYPEMDLRTDPLEIASDAELAGVFLSSREAEDLARAAAFRVERQALQRVQADRLAQQLPLPQIRLPFLFSDDVGPAEIGVLADALRTGIEQLDA